MEKPKVAVLFSGGKDSSLALVKVRDNMDVKFLLNVNVKNRDSFMFHKPDVKLLERQASELGIPLIIVESKGEENKELKDLRKLMNIVKNEVSGIVVGGIASSYQGKRVKKICKELGLKFIAPLLGYDGEKLWDEILKNKMKVILTKISSEGLGKEWLGKVIGGKEVEQLMLLAKKYKFRLDFEGGEAESSVLYMPGMKNQIKLDFDVKSEGEYRHLMKIQKIKK